MSLFNMSFKIKHSEKFVGFFMLVGIIAILITIIFMGREQKWFQKKYKLYTQFDSGDGLASGVSVKINGLEVGSVSEVKFSTNRGINVTFTVYEDFIHKVHTDTYVFKEASSPLGGSYLNLTAGTGAGNVVKNGAILFSQDSEQVQELLDRNLIPQKTSSFDNIIKNINQLTYQLSLPNGPLLGTLNNVKIITRGLASPGGSFYALTSGNKVLYNEVIKTIANIRKITSDFNVLSAVIRNSSPEIKNIISSAEKGLKETTQVMIGLQRYFAIQGKSPKDNSKTKPFSVIKFDRRKHIY
ncbi:MAG: MCE family protein [Spirochaetes bacterium]|nr:MCE family protein [Spirochaetota bacterium]